jgi:plastocyanin
MEVPMPRVTRLAVALALTACLSVPLTAVAADDEFKLVILDHKFQPTEVVVPAGRKVKLVVENRDATPEEFESHALGREKVIAGKSTATIFIGPLKAGRYDFVGEYNEKTAKGTIVVQ